MTITVTRAQLATLAPHALPVYLRAFDLIDSVLPVYSIATTLRLQHFTAQVLHESGGLTILQESMNYSPAGLVATFGGDRITPAQAQKYGRTPDHPADQRAIANIVYGGAWGRKNLGNTDVDDGWNFRGTGMLQLTGREDRARYGAQLGIDLTGHPELALDPQHMLAIAAAEWSFKGCNAFADRDDIRAVTRKINGGVIGLDQREVMLAKVKAVIGA